MKTIRRDRASGAGEREPNSNRIVAVIIAYLRAAIWEPFIFISFPSISQIVVINNVTAKWYFQCNEIDLLELHLVWLEW